ncbi:fimbrial biogenesis chaperone [Sulfurimonas diazotrophicus]|uniref:Fimbria/pilus periplasmic chaperone n=1 Tax=Sulfurimonas diazotrophicus TaxID=3131939 RepID=A0ABZ3HC99_9BACT
MSRALLAALLIGYTSLWAGFQVYPIRVYLDPETPVATVKVTNQSEEKRSFEVETMRWTQDANGSDRYDKDASLLAVPLLFTLEGKASQTVRITDLSPNGKKAQSAYRLFISELPAKHAEETGGLHMLFRVAIPVFITTAASTETLLTLDTIEKSPTTFNCWLRNDSSHFVRISKLYLVTAKGEHGVQVEPAKYLLPGSKASFNFTLDPGFTPSALHIFLEDGQRIELAI